MEITKADIEAKLQALKEKRAELKIEVRKLDSEIDKNISVIELLFPEE